MKNIKSGRRTRLNKDIFDALINIHQEKVSLIQEYQHQPMNIGTIYTTPATLLMISLKMIKIE